MNNVANEDLGNLAFTGPIGSFDQGCLWLQPCQFAYRGACLSARTSLQPATDQDQSHYDGCRFKIYNSGAFGQNAGYEQRDGGKPPGGQAAHSDQAVHVRVTFEKIGYAATQKDGARTDQNQRGQHELNGPGHVLPKGLEHPIMEHGKKMAAHFQHKDRQRQDRSDDHLPPCVFNFGGGRIFVRHVIGWDRCAVSCRTDRADCVIDLHHTGHSGDARGPVSKIDCRFGDPRQRC